VSSRWGLFDSSENSFVGVKKRSFLFQKLCFWTPFSFILAVPQAESISLENKLGEWNGLGELATHYPPLA
jgi:hypothetical protein